MGSLTLSTGPSLIVISYYQSVALTWKIFWIRIQTHRCCITLAIEGVKILRPGSLSTCHGRITFRISPSHKKATKPNWYMVGTSISTDRWPSVTIGIGKLANFSPHGCLGPFLGGWQMETNCLPCRREKTNALSIPKCPNWNLIEIRTEIPCSICRV